MNTVISHRYDNFKIWTKLHIKTKNNDFGYYAVI